MPPWLATSTLPSATIEVAKSRISGERPGRGTPTQYGAVENRRSMPPKGATSTLPAALTKCTDTSPLAAAISAKSPTRPMCPALRRATADSPIARHLSMPIAVAAGATVWPKPNLPSTTEITGVSTTTAMVWSGTVAPLRTFITYRGTRTTPWLSWPDRFADTR